MRIPATAALCTIALLAAIPALAGRPKSATGTATPSPAPMDMSKPMDMAMPMSGACDPKSDSPIKAVADAVAAGLSEDPPAPPGYGKVLPPSVAAMLATKSFRQMHSTWHLVRDNWNCTATQAKAGDCTLISAADKATLTKEGWDPPRTTGQPGSGRDFICMHHMMIGMVNDALKKANDPSYPQVEGVPDSALPLGPNDPNWPMPPWPNVDPSTPEGKANLAKYGPAPSYKLPAQAALYQNKVATEYSQDSWLQKQDIDTLGLEFEEGIHGYLHMHLSATGANIPPDGMNCDGNTQPPCDWLGDPEDAHVNPAFWTVIHGWIEAKALRVVALNHPGVDPSAELTRECAAGGGPNWPYPAFEDANNKPMTAASMKGMPASADLDAVLSKFPRQTFKIVDPK
jgi:hypothetical protein